MATSPTSQLGEVFILTSLSLILPSKAIITAKQIRT